MEKAAWVLIFALVLFTLAGCSLFFDAKIVSYSVSCSVDSVSVEIVATDGDGIVFTESTQTDWDYEFEVKYSDFPFLAHIVVTNNDGAESVDMTVYRDDTVVDSDTVAIGEMGVITTMVTY